MTAQEALKKGYPLEKLQIAKCEYCESVVDLTYLPGIGYLCPVHLQEYEEYMYQKHLEHLNDVYERDPNF